MTDRKDNFPEHTPLTGGCLCGGVRYELRERPFGVVDCHCIDCRRSSGAPYVTWGIVQRNNFSIVSGSLRRVPFAERVRGFAACCGTQILFEDAPDHPRVDVAIATLDDPRPFPPERAIWTEDKLPWVALDPELPASPTIPVKTAAPGSTPAEVGKPRTRIALCEPADIPAILEIINESAAAYKGVIPADRWHEPYMSKSELESEISRGVRFYGSREGGRLVGVMGIQDVKDVTLIRHAYVRTAQRGRGVGRELLARLTELTSRPVLIGTWKAATWAIRFYEQNGFTVVSDDEKNRLLRIYWTVPERQIEESVVLVDRRWMERAGGQGK